MSNLFGTFVTTETTYVSLDQRLGDGVKGTKRLVHEYRISPDEIKGIPPLTAFYYDKRRPDVVYKVKFPSPGAEFPTSLPQHSRCCESVNSLSRHSLSCFAPFRYSTVKLTSPHPQLWGNQGRSENLTTRKGSQFASVNLKGDITQQ